MRSLLKSPAFTAIAVLTLALGLGATTAIFSAVHAILIEPLPFAESERLVAVRTMVKRETWERRSSSIADFRDYRAGATRSFEGMAIHDGINVTLAATDSAERIRAELVSHDYFHVLRTAPAIGRTFSAEEDSAPGGQRLVVLGHTFWQRRFAGSPNVLGQTLRLSDSDYTIIGVMPAGFLGLDDSTQLWLPTSILNAADWNARNSRSSSIVGRLRPGATLEQASAELAAIGRRLADEHPQSNTNYGADAAPLRDEFFGNLRRPLLVLLGSVGFVLFITCANVANLMLVRLAHRRREIAVRVSLGAGRGPLVRLFLGEAALLTTLGGGLGLLLAAWLLAALRQFAPVELPRFVELGLQWPAFAFALALAVLCALAIGAIPALLATRIDLHAALKDAGRSGGGSASGSRVRAALVTIEIALSLALLLASTLFVRSFVNLVTQPTGYRTERIVSHRMLLTGARYDEAARRQFARTLLERAAALPGVRHAALASDTPLEGNTQAMMVSVEGAAPTPAENEARVYHHTVTADFFAAYGITLLQGETFAASYAPGSERVAIVSENFARRFWPKGDALGKRFRQGRLTPDNRNPWMRIIAVAAEVKYRGLTPGGPADPDFYRPFDQVPPQGFVVAVHTTSDSATQANALQQVVAGIDPSVAVFGVATIERRLAAASANQRFSAQLMGGFALVALLLAAIGLYGVVSFSVGQRTQEIGVRMALGARPVDIARMILGGTSRLVAIGLLAGAVLALGLTRYIETLLFHVNPRDPWIYAGVAAALALVALLAAWVPARRAAKVDPMVALRAE